MGLFTKKRIIVDLTVGPTVRKIMAKNKKARNKKAINKKQKEDMILY